MAGSAALDTPPGARLQGTEVAQKLGEKEGRAEGRCPRGLRRGRPGRSLQVEPCPSGRRLALPGLMLGAQVS